MEITLDQAFQLFLADRETSCTEDTLSYYKENILNFFLYCQDCFGRPYNRILCVEITRQVFTDYIRHLRNRPKFQNHPFLKASEDTLSGTSIRTYARAIKSFSNFCKDNGFCESFTYKVKLPRADSREIIPLYSSEVADIDSQFNLKTEFGLRNWCIVHLMLDAGLRTSEVVHLRFCDLLFDKNIIRIFRSKGEKTRLVLMCPRLKANILKYSIIYRNYMELPEKESLFIQMRNHQPINDNVIKQLFARLKKKSGIDRLHPHLLRHTFATSYVCGGGNIEMLRLLLGHCDYDVTKIYLHLAQQSKLLHYDIYRLDPVFFQKY